MKNKLHRISAPKKPSNIIYIEVDPVKVPNKGLLEARLKNKAQTFEDRRFKKPRYRKDYIED